MPEMKPRLAPMLLTAVAAALLLPAVPAMADRRDQDAAYSQLRAGGIRPLREIEGRYVGRVAGEYLGPEFDSGSATYRLKFMRAGRVIWIDIDARTGREIGRSGE